MFDLSEKVVVVTGASRGIGRAIAVGAANAGADVVGVARTQAALAELGRDVEAAGRRYLPVVADLLDLEAIETVARVAWEWQGRVEVLVNAAGMIVRSEPPTVTPEHWDIQFALNARSPFFLMQAFAKRMLAGEGGAIVNVTSVAGEVTTGASTVYAATKAALMQMTRVLAVRWAPRIRVNAVGPSYIRTDINSAWLDDPTNSRYVLERTPMGRFGEPADVVGAVIFLASRAAAYITGQHLLVDGGWTAQ
jgi:NAD(P)-dependent dehydrogenase (short-subunit alcohol dehydrogenase family)